MQTAIATKQAINSRAQELKAAAQAFIDVHHRWQNDATEENPTAEYWDSLEDFLNCAGSGDIPEESLGIIEAAQKLKVRFDEFDRSDEMNPMPNRKFFGAVEAVAQALETPDETEPHCIMESMASLKASGCTLTQIATIYDLKDHRGNWDVTAVTRELNNPGSVIGPDYVPPKLRDWRAARKQRRLLVEKQFQENPIVPRPVEPPPVCPESPADLWAQKLTPQQASVTLQRPLAEIERIWSELDAEKAAKETPSTPESFRERALAMHASGKKPAEISQILNLGISEVNRILKSTS